MNAARIALLQGGQPEAMRVIHSAPRLEDLWQLHFSQLSGQEYTVPGVFIANEMDEALTAMPIATVPPPQGRGAPPAPMHKARPFGSTYPPVRTARSR